MREDAKTKILLNLTIGECKLLQEGIVQLIREREQESRELREDCMRAAALAKGEAEILRLIHDEIKRQSKIRLDGN